MAGFSEEKIGRHNSRIMKNSTSNQKTNSAFSGWGLTEFSISANIFSLWILLTFTAMILMRPADSTAREFPGTAYTIAGNFRIHNITDSEYSREIPDTVSFWNAFRSGKFNLDIRMRSEFVGQSGVKDGRAVTNKVQLGYETNSFRGFSGYVDFVNVFAFTPGQYNAAGLNDQPGYAVVADPELTVLNQYYLHYSWKQAETGIRIGRQRIIHDDARFIGNVGWRQNEQTYDAASVQTTFGSTPLHAFYSYVWQVNRIFGPEHSAGVLDSDLHLLHLSYEGMPAARLAGYVYLFQFQEYEQLSVQTFGGRLDGAVDFGNESLEWNYLISYGIQKPYRSVPDDYTVGHFRMNTGIQKSNIGQIGLGYEAFGSDSGVAFQTPLATLHAYQGWADSFLAIPAEGLRDIYLKAGLRIPFNVNVKARYHWFKFYGENVSLGRELNLSLGKELHENLKFLLKYANYDAVKYGRNTSKLWIQLQFKI